jgi:hypothetical protein
MATSYQNFRTDLVNKLNTTSDPDLVQMVNDLIDYTDSLIEQHIAPGQPPLIPISGGGSKFAETNILGDKSGQPPLIPTSGGGSKIT